MKTIKLYKKLKKFGDGTSDVTEGTDTLGGTPKGENFAKGVGAANAGIQIANMGYQMLGEKGDEFGVKSDAGAIGGGALSGAAMGAGLGSIAGPWGCVCTGTKVITNLGEFKNVEDLKQEDGIIGWNGSEYIQQNIVGFQPPAQKECLEIETGLGHKLRCSIDHPIYSSGQGRAKRFYVKGIRTRIKKYEYIDAENLKIGDNIGLINEIPIWGAKVMAIPYLVGACIGDGTYGKNKGVRLTTGDSDTWEYIESNDLGYQIDKKNTDLKYNKEFRIYRLKNTIEVFRKLGIYEQTKENKRLPDNIHLYNKDSICKLIAGLIDTDGYVSFNSKKPRNGKIGFCQSNIELIKQVREQLTKLGIHSSLKTNKATKKVITDKECNIKEAYILLIKDKYSVINFYNNISLNISYKKNNLKALYNHINECGTKDHKEHTNVCADKIIKITPIGLQDIYNLEAAGSHTYIANLIITHNTAIGGVVGGLAGGIKGFIDNKASKEAAEEYQKRQLQLQVQGDKDKWQQTLASGFKVQGNEYATKYAKYGGLLYKKMGDDGKFKPNTESEVDNTKILRNYELPQKFNSQGLRTNLVGNRTGNEIKKDFGKTGTGEIEESISPMDIVGGVKAIGYGAKLTKSIVSDLTKGVVRRLNPKNLKVEKTASDWMKERYSDPSVLKKIEKYKENNKQGFISVTDEKKQNFDIDEYLNMGKNPSFKLDKKDVYINNPSKVKFEDANYIDLLKNKGLKQYVEKSISSKGVSYGDPKTYTNRTSFFPFDKKGKEGVKVHENTHALTTNGRAFNKENDDLLKPFGETHESYQNKFSNQKLGHNEKYYLDPTEIHARLNQSRYELKHSPNQKYTLEDLENSLSSNNLNGMGKYIKDKNAFVDMANKMYTIPAVITSGSAISKYKEKEMGGIIYNSQNKKSLYKNGGNVQQLSKNIVEFKGNSHEMGGIKLSDKLQLLSGRIDAPELNGYFIKKSK
jgi:hypothetical protein